MALVHRGGRPYLYKSVRRGGRVTSEYVASGESAVLISRLEAAWRQRDEDEREDWKAERRRMDAEEADAAELFDRVEVVVREALETAGYHRHKRGEWRKRRG
jgi:hypothetical protein